MIRRLRPLGLSAVLLLLVSLPVAAQDSVAGRWIVTVASAEMGQIEMAAVLEQSGSEVSGRVDLAGIPQVEAAQISDGLYEDRIVSFLLHVSAQGQWFTLEVEADVEDDEMVGEMYLPEMNLVAPFTARRADD